MLSQTVRVADESGRKRPPRSVCPAAKRLRSSRRCSGFPAESNDECALNLRGGRHIVIGDQLPALSRLLIEELVQHLCVLLIRLVRKQLRADPKNLGFIGVHISAPFRSVRAIAVYWLFYHTAAAAARRLSAAQGLFCAESCGTISAAIVSGGMYEAENA